ncbi:hypothetical protein CROQUDRAFT_659173 [Cronartium quercuum f. sp. fusiforme G11]|uniref:Response regulatory domain-containing protein n=1 Tax=Cronartium quercuum f. sp. fusiforme G11 TaxID=708437 RepID=A0A9P6NK77_9BASI|nr:hypothetical protein CROQUDRAFT_659173 [Cronartium quercuum f. sp. fusiforme G11]
MNPTTTTTSSSSSSSSLLHQAHSSNPLTPPLTERRDPFKTLIRRPFLRRNHTLESIKDSLKLTLTKHSSNVSNPITSNPTSSFTVINRPSPSNSSSNRSYSPLPRLNSISRPNSPQIDHHHQQQHEQSSSLSSSLSSSKSRINRTKLNQIQSTISLPITPNLQLPPQLTTEPLSIPSSHSSFAIQPDSPPFLSASAITSSIHSLLTQPALATLTQLAPAQLLSGVHSGSFNSSDAFSILHDPQSNQFSNNIANSDPNNPNQRLPTTIEQLSASSIALPITSISSIWRLLNCIEWINSKESELLTQPISSLAPKSRFNSYSSVTSQKLTTTDHQTSFDLANVLQHVGDILSAISSESDVEMVFYHIFYPPKPESTELITHDHSLPPTSSPSLPGSHKTCLSGDSLSSSTSDQFQGESNVYLGAGADGEGGLREISVKADEKGLIIGLTCLLRQILYRAKKFSTIEVGLHLTPLYKDEQQKMKTKSSSKEGNSEDEELQTPREGHHHEFGIREHQLDLKSIKPSSWKCVFEVSLNPPASPPQSDAPTLTKPKDSFPDPSIAIKSIPHHLREPELPPSPNLARIRMSSHLSSELPLCPEESLSKLIFERSLGMRLRTGRLTRSGHSWKVIGVFEKGVDRESPATVVGPNNNNNNTNTLSPAFTQVTSHAPQRKSLGPAAREPTADELTLFAETALKGKKAVFFAAEQSIFAKHITTYLTSWNMDVSHMPYEPGDGDCVSRSASIKSPEMATLALGSDLKNDASSMRSGDSGISNPVEGSSAAAAPSTKGSNEPADPSPPADTAAPTQAATSKFVRSNSFIIIDDDIPTLKLQLTRLKNSPPTSIHLPPNVVQSKHQASAKRPPFSRQMKSVSQINRTGTEKQLNPSIIHFTSISNFRKVQDLIRIHLAGTPWVAIPDVLVVPKPIGPRRILTALHTAVNRPAVEPQFVPIATSPSSPGPGMPHYFVNSIGTSQLGRTSPALPHLGVDFESAAAKHLERNASHSTIQTEALSTGVQTTNNDPSLQSSTPPGLRTPGTAPGTPGFPSPAMLSHEALEYFSKAASENGGSSSTGVVLQSPDGRPQAMFFHHSTSSVRSSVGTQSLSTFVSPFHQLMLTLPKKDLASTSMTSGGNEFGRTNSSRPMVREIVDPSAPASASESATVPVTTTTASSDIFLSSSTPSSSSGGGGSSSRGATRKLENVFGPAINSPLRVSGGGFKAMNPSENIWNYAMALDKYEAVSPKTPTATFTPESLSSLSPLPGLSLLTAQQRLVLMNPRPSPMLRMPSVPASLPSSITATLPSPRRPPISHAMTTKGPATESVKSVPGPSNQKVPRRASMGDQRFAKRRASRKPATTLVPPINVLIVEDNRINQTILATFLRKKSVRYDVAMNGQEAVDKWRTGSFHLVLMDLQLPVKDGIEATKEIREAERSQNIHAFGNTPPTTTSSTTMTVPHAISVIIVALTASSLDVDREVALAAGCNDFLTKPVSLAWLEKKLLEWGSMAWLSGFNRPVVGMAKAREVAGKLTLDNQQNSNSIISRRKLDEGLLNRAGSGKSYSKIKSNSHEVRIAIQVPTPTRGVSDTEEEEEEGEVGEVRSKV